MTVGAYGHLATINLRIQVDRNLTEPAAVSVIPFRDSNR